MSRSDSVVGLNEFAENLVGGKKVLLYTDDIRRTYPDGRIENLPDQKVFSSDVTKEESGENFHGYDTYPLYMYTFADGRIYWERVYTEISSSGPVFFLALQDEMGNWLDGSQWSREEIKQYI